jgi:hypothetical protein
MKIDLDVEQRKRWGQADRQRKKVQLTLSDEARAILGRKSNMSAYVERLILEDSGRARGDEG